MHNPHRIADARKRIDALVEISRWIWLVNLAAMIVGLIYGRYHLAGLAAFTGVLAIVAAASGRRASEFLGGQQQAEGRWRAEEIRERHSPAETLF